jgi:uncharacterized protein
MTSLIKWAIAIGAILVAPLAGQVQAAPSFDCAKASTRVERMICDNPRIAQLDSELADAYRIALRDAPWASANRRIREEQKAWVAERNRCRDPRCLRQSYRQRIAQLRSEVSGGGNSGGGNTGGGGNVVRVTGVASNDVLNVRSGPGPNYRVVGALGNGDRVRRLNCQNQGSSRWCQIEMMTDMRERGWVNVRFLSGSGGSSSSQPGGAINHGGGVRTACARAVARQVGVSPDDVVVTRSTISEGTGRHVVYVGVPYAAADWICEADRNGRVVNVFFSGSG